jgi:hypothetical protein
MAEGRDLFGVRYKIHILVHFRLLSSYMILLGGGWAGTEHFIDPVSGIAVVFGTQVVPLANAKTVAVWARLEALIYAALNSATSAERLKSNL